MTTSLAVMKLLNRAVAQKEEAEAQLATTQAALEEAKAAWAALAIEEIGPLNTDEAEAFATLDRILGPRLDHASAPSLSADQDNEGEDGRVSYSRISPKP